jgi:hypothetical protein
LDLRDKPEDDNDEGFVEEASFIYICIMTKLLDQALEAVHKLPPRAQDEVAEVMIALAASDGEPEPIDATHLPAVLRGLDRAAARVCNR